MAYQVGGVRSVSSGAFFQINTDAIGNVTVDFNAGQPYAPVVVYQAVLTDSDILNLHTGFHLLAFAGSIGAHNQLLGVILEYRYGGVTPIGNVHTGDISISHQFGVTGPGAFIGNSSGLLNYSTPYPSDSAVQRIYPVAGAVTSTASGGGIYMKNNAAAYTGGDPGSESNELHVTLITGFAPF